MKDKVQEIRTLSLCVILHPLDCGACHIVFSRIENWWEQTEKAEGAELD